MQASELKNIIGFFKVNEDEQETDTKEAQVGLTSKPRPHKPALSKKMEFSINVATDDDYVSI